MWNLLPGPFSAPYHLLEKEFAPAACGQKSTMIGLLFIGGRRVWIIKYETSFYPHHPYRRASGKRRHANRRAKNKPPERWKRANADFLILFLTARARFENVP
jgi:hypothetical protein